MSIQNSIDMIDKVTAAMNESMESKEAGIAIEAIFERIKENHFPDSTCRGCRDFTETKDPFCTGDSPTEYECGGVPEGCPIVRKIVELMGGKLK